MDTNAGHNVDADGGVLLGIDIGGTAVKAGIVDMDGALLGKWILPTPELFSRADILAFAEAMAEKAASSSCGQASADPRHSISCVGIAIPGAVSPDGSVSMIPNARIDTEMLAECICERFGGVPTKVLNDSGAAALGEGWVGAGRGLDSFALVTLGTGIGCGVVAGGRLLEGAHGAAGEIGHMIVERDGCPCGCGGKGCLERYASATGLVDRARDLALAHGRDPESPELSEAESIISRSCGEAAEPACSQAVDEMCDKLGLALANLACAVDPEAILIGGGVSGSADAFIGTLRERFSEYAVAPCKKTPIVVAGTGNWAGTVGAARAAMLLLGAGDAAKSERDPIPAANKHFPERRP